MADDLIWASRLQAAVEKGGATPLGARSHSELDHLLAAGSSNGAPSGEVIEAVIIDLNGRAYDGLAAVRTASESGKPVLAVGQHDDVALRQDALAAGARRVLSYNKLFRAGPDVVARLLEGSL
jgi:DNA-binding response OmpR family regulator